MINLPPCILCNSTEFKDVVSNCHDYEYNVLYKSNLIRCEKCGLYCLSPKPALKDLFSFYPSEYANYSKSKSIITRFLVSMYERKSKTEVRNLIGNKGRVLDIGCADGSYLDLLKGSKWELCGTDISHASAKTAIENGYKVYIGEVESVDIPANSFDLIRMSHVIEHVINPKTTLEKAYHILKPGGHLIIETPNVACPDFYIFGKYWGAFHFPRHIHLFSINTLQKILEDSKLIIRDIDFTLMPTGWSLSIQNFLSYKLNLTIVNGRISIYPCLMLLFVPVLFIQKIFKCSTMVKLIIQKSISS